MSRLCVEVLKNFITAASSNEGEFETSITTAERSQSVGKTFTGDGVDARARRRRYDIVTLAREHRDEPGPDEPAATNNDDLHPAPRLKGLTIAALERLGADQQVSM